MYAIRSYYVPNGQSGEERLTYKMAFYDRFLDHINDLRAKGKSIVVCGDVNTAHRPIDLARPKANEQTSGFLPMEREWMDKLFSHGYVDTFRHIHGDKPERYVITSYSIHYTKLYEASNDGTFSWFDHHCALH